MAPKKKGYRTPKKPVPFRVPVPRKPPARRKKSK